MQQQQWELLFSLWSVLVMTSGNNRPTQQSKCFLCGPITGFFYNQANQDRPDLSSEAAPVIDKTILVNVNRNKYQVVRPLLSTTGKLFEKLIMAL
jgi:hypothetical protein